MMKILFIIIIAIVIILCVYLSYKKDFKGAIACACLAAAFSFIGPYIVETVENFNNNILSHEHEKAYERKENVINATCFEEGKYELVSYCECGKELDREEVIVEPFGHNYIADIIEPTCEETGFTTYTCSRCQDSYVEDYIDAFGHDFIKGICSRCGFVSSEFESVIISEANELVKFGNYDEALKIVCEALDIVSSNSLQKLLDDIQLMQEKNSKYEAKSVNFITYSGTINSDDQTDTYLLEVLTTGQYRFDVSDMISGFTIKLYIYDASGEKVGGGSGYGNDNGVTCELVQGNSYTIKVISCSNTGNYTLTIGQQKEKIDITTKDIICDSIEYTDQENEYTFVPAIDGTYRFDFFDVISGFTVKCYIYDSLGYKVGGGSGYGNDNGVTVELIAKEIYTIKIIQHSSKGIYNIAIGRQQATQDITGKNSIYGNITFREQKNIYTYTPTTTGKYIFSFSNMVNEFSVKLYIYDSLGYKVGGGSGYGNGNEITVELTENKTYTIHLIQHSNTGSYDMNIFREDR